MPDAGDDISAEAWAAFRERLRTYVGARVDPSSSDDVVAEILLRLVRHRQQLAAARDPMAWVTRVAANTVIDLARRRAAEGRAMRAYAAELAVAAPSETAEAASPDGTLAACLVPFVKTLPAANRAAIELVDLHGLTQRQAAERLGLSLSGLKSRVQRGRAKLKQALLDCCTVELDRLGGVIDFSTGDESRTCCRGVTC